MHIQISMLWNWYTVDACFISSDWHIHSEGRGLPYSPSLTYTITILVAFAFTVICVFILVALVEGVRRFGREYDRRIVSFAQLGSKVSESG